MDLNKVFENKKIWEEATCPICDKNGNLAPYEKISSWEYKGTYSLVECKKCGLVFQSPRLEWKYVHLYYQSENYWGKKKPSTSFPNKRYGYVYRRYKGTTPGSILDIGCGTGGFLSWFKSKGWKVLGTDISPEAIKYAKKNLGIEVLLGDLMDLNIKKDSFDVVSLTHVLEHLYDPAKSLSKISTLLRKKGELIITVPNHRSLGRILFGANWLQYQPGRHLYYYAPDTLTQILDKSGFKITKVDYWTVEDSYYSIFQSFRYAFSPKFNKSLDVRPNPRRRLNFSLVYELKKVVAVVFSWAIFTLEYLFGLSDVVTVYAGKKN